LHWLLTAIRRREHLGKSSILWSCASFLKLEVVILQPQAPNTLELTN
jgi:hypothetical protein